MMRSTNRTGRRWMALAAMSAGLAALATSKSALAESQWSGGNSGNWNTPGNWSPSGVPGAGTIVEVISSAGATQTINYNYTGAPVILAQLTLDLTGGSGTASETLNMSANNLTSIGEDIGDSGFGSNGSGTFNQSGGVNTIAVGNALLLALNSTDQGVYNLSGTGLLSSAENEIVGFMGTGIFNQTGGTNNMTGSLGILNLASYAGSTGTYTLSNGSLSAVLEVVGYQGAGVFNQTGGTNVIGTTGSELDIGANASSVGAYNLSGGSAMVIGEVLIGGSSSGVGGTGTLTVSNTGQMTVTGPIWIFPGSQNVLTLSGGSITTGTLTFGTLGGSVFNQSACNQFVWTGGTLDLTGEIITIDSTSAANFGDSAGTPNSFVLGAGQTLQVSGNERIGFNGTGNFLQTGGSNTITGNNNLDLGFNSGATGTYTLSGGHPHRRR